MLNNKDQLLQLRIVKENIGLTDTAKMLCISIERVRNILEDKAPFPKHKKYAVGAAFKRIAVEKYTELIKNGHA